jgi:hypothetical protein
MSAKTVTHRFNVWITVPAVSGDGWGKYPDYSADELGRWIRRCLNTHSRDVSIEVEHADTDELP